jgi:hypothetical protein
MSELQWYPGDKVFYMRDNSGWGGGATWSIIARVAVVHKKMATIALWNQRKNKHYLKRVALKSLETRHSTFPELDNLVLP